MRMVRAVTESEIEKEDEQKVERARQVQDLEDFDQFVRDELFQEKLKRAKTKFTPDMNLDQHIYQVDSDRRFHNEQSKTARRRFLEKKQKLDAILRERRDIDTGGVYSEFQGWLDGFYSDALEMVKHETCSQALSESIANEAIKFSRSILGKSLQEIWASKFEDKVDSLFPRIAEMFSWMERAGLQPGKKLETLQMDNSRTLSKTESVVGKHKPRKKIKEAEDADWYDKERATRGGE
jgi:hypothetical protein